MTQHHAKPAKIGVLITNLGTPDAPDAPALRRYLCEFLWDPRVVEQPRWLWWLALHGVILNVRPKKSAESYQKVWEKEGPDGSPLMRISKAQVAALRQRFQTNNENICIELAMRYGNPSIKHGLQALQAQGCKKILLLPLYPQYSATTTASTYDAVFDVFKTWRRTPAFRAIDSYHDNPAYIEALASSVRQHWQQHGQGERLLMSFHGIPERYYKAGDPYPDHCWKTSRLLRQALGLDESQAFVTFQSRFGREPWMQPYTDKTLEQWGKDGVGNIDVICPGFSADCLETLEEIRMENAEIFNSAGGGEMRYIPALNDSPAHIEALTQLIHCHLQGWQTNSAANGETHA